MSIQLPDPHSMEEALKSIGAYVRLAREKLADGWPYSTQRLLDELAQSLPQHEDRHIHAAMADLQRLLNEEDE